MNKHVYKWLSKPRWAGLDIVDLIILGVAVLLVAALLGSGFRCELRITDEPVVLPPASNAPAAGEGRE